MNNQLVSFSNVCFSYQGDETLCEVSLNINKGDFLGIIGPNGSGKTTLLKLMLGLLSPQNGDIKLWGTGIKDFEEWARIGYVPQKANAIQSKLPITVEEVVSMGRVQRVGIGRPYSVTDKEAITAACEAVELQGVRQKNINELSGGQQQRAFIARALATEPEMLILDEPTVGVDAEVQDNFYKIIGDLNKKGITIVLVSHDLEVVLNEVNKIVCLNKKIVYHGDPNNFDLEKYSEKIYGKSRKFIDHHH